MKFPLTLILFSLFSFSGCLVNSSDLTLGLPVGHGNASDARGQGISFSYNLETTSVINREGNEEPALSFKHGEDMVFLDHESLEPIFIRSTQDSYLQASRADFERILPIVPLFFSGLAESKISGPHEYMGLIANVVWSDESLVLTLDSPSTIFEFHYEFGATHSVPEQITRKIFVGGKMFEEQVLWSLDSFDGKDEPFVSAGESKITPRQTEFSEAGLPNSGMATFSFGPGEALTFAGANSPEVQAFMNDFFITWVANYFVDGVGLVDQYFSTAHTWEFTLRSSGESLSMVVSKDSITGEMEVAMVSRETLPEIEIKNTDKVPWATAQNLCLGGPNNEIGFIDDGANIGFIDTAFGGARQLASARFTCSLNECFIAINAYTGLLQARDC